MAYHNACQTMPRACGGNRVRAREARGHVGGSETVAGRRGIDDLRLHRLGLDRIRNALQTQDARRLRKFQHHLGPRNPRQQVFSAFARIERQQILGRGQHDIGEMEGIPKHRARKVQIGPAAGTKIRIERKTGPGFAREFQRRKQILPSILAIE